MTRYAAMFERCAARGEGAFGAFLMLGDPDPAASAVYLDALVEGGADMVEFGIPFSDPVADGPIIQAASVRALKAGVRTADCLSMIAAFRSRHPDIPVGVLTYANIVAARGIDRFAAELAVAGADSMLVADVPSIEAHPYAAAARKAGIDHVMIAAPNTPPETLACIAALTSGYTYCVARPGVTGSHDAVELAHSELFARLASCGAPPPVVGFGMSTPAHVATAMAQGAAGVICGSAIVALLAQHRHASQIAAFVAQMKEAALAGAKTAAYAR
jgi:tryptophan synthase alpha chain